MEEADREEEKGGGGAGGFSPTKRCRELWHDTRMKLWSIVESKYFNRGIMIAILINTISMGIEHHQQVHSRLPVPMSPCPHSLLSRPSPF